MEIVGQLTFIARIVWHAVSLAVQIWLRLAAEVEAGRSVHGDVGAQLSEYHKDSSQCAAVIGNRGAEIARARVWDVHKPRAIVCLCVLRTPACTGCSPVDGSGWAHGGARTLSACSMGR